MTACCRCGRRAGEVLVGLPMSASGAGGPAFYGCLTCARVCARLALTPDWLTEEIAKAEARLDPP